MVLSACYEFVAACVPFPELVGVPRIFGMMDSLLSDKESGVQTLEKLSVQNLIKMAITSPQKAEELRMILDSTITMDFSPLAFSDCPEIGEFIIDRATVGIIAVQPERTLIAFSEDRFLKKNYPRNEVPIEKIIELLLVIFKRAPERVTFQVHNDVLKADSIVEKITQLKNDERCEFEEVDIMMIDDYIRIVFFNQ